MRPSEAQPPPLHKRLLKGTGIVLGICAAIIGAGLLILHAKTLVVTGWQWVAGSRGVNYEAMIDVVEPKIEFSNSSRTLSGLVRNRSDRSLLLVDVTFVLKDRSGKTVEELLVQIDNVEARSSKRFLQQSLPGNVSHVAVKTIKAY
jgi:hypothetical protein